MFSFVLNPGEHQWPTIFDNYFVDPYNSDEARITSACSWANLLLEVIIFVTLNNVNIHVKEQFTLSTDT